MARRIENLESTSDQTSSWQPARLSTTRTARNTLTARSFEIPSGTLSDKGSVSMRRRSSEICMALFAFSRAGQSFCCLWD